MRLSPRNNRAVITQESTRFGGVLLPADFGIFFEQIWIFR